MIYVQLVSYKTGTVHDILIPVADHLALPYRMLARAHRVWDIRTSARVKDRYKSYPKELTWEEFDFVMGLTPLSVEEKIELFNKYSKNELLFE